MRKIYSKSKMMFRVFIVLFGFSGLIPVGLIWANPSDRDRLPDKPVYEAVDLKLRGSAVLKYLVFVKAYSGSFYMPENADVTRLFDPIPKRLTLEYHVPINASDLAEATTAMIRRNVDEGRFAALKNRIDRLNSLYRDVQPEDRYSLTYLPGVGTELSLNGKSLGVIKGHDFSKAVFSIWLGNNPIDRSFRNQLLGMR